MKKTLIALATAAFLSTTANATVIYQQEGSKIDLDGRVALELSNQTGKRTDLIDRGSRVRVRAFQELSGGFSALGAVELRFTQHGTLGDGIHTKRLFAGFSHEDIGTLTFGRQLVAGDAIGLADFTYELGAIVKVTDAHNKAIHFASKEFEGFSVQADYLFGNSNKYTANDKTADAGKGFNLAAFYHRDFGDFKFATEGGYGEITKGTLESDEYKAKLAGAAISLGYGPATLALDWAHAKSPKGHEDHGFRVGATKFEKIDQFELGFKYQITPETKVFAEYLWGVGKDSGIEEKGKFRGWFLGAGHKLHKNVEVYTEGGAFKTKYDGDTLDKEKRVGLGMRVFF